MPFLRRQIGARLRLKRVPELKFMYDESIAGQDRVEQLLRDLRDASHAPGETPHDDDQS
jgi:ribosome-binding factor A